MSAPEGHEFSEAEIALGKKFTDYYNNLVSDSIPPDETKTHYFRKTLGTDAEAITTNPTGEEKTNSDSS